MKKNQWFVWLLVAAGFIYFLKTQRDDPGTEPTEPPSEHATNPEEILDGIELTITYALKGDAWPTQVKLLNKEGVAVGLVPVRKGVAKLNNRQDVEKILIEARGHKKLSMLWPRDKKINVSLTASSEYLDKALVLPKNSTEEICALKISERDSENVLAQVQVYLDGILIGDSSNVGVCMIELAVLKKGKELTLKKSGFKTKKIVLTDGKIDEFKVEGVFLEKISSK
jgi:hypothetical protein